MCRNLMQAPAEMAAGPTRLASAGVCSETASIGDIVLHLTVPTYR